MTRAARLATGIDQHRGIALYILSGLVFAGLDAYVKAMTATIPVLHLLWARSVVFLVLIIVLGGRRDPKRLLRTRVPMLQVARGVALFASMVGFFFSLATVPLGIVNALVSASPLIVVALAGPVLHERVTRPAVVGAVVGFGGVLMLVGWDGGGFDARMLLPLGSAAGYAIFSLLSRAVRHEPANVTLFYTGALVALCATVSIVMVGSRTALEPGQWLAAGLIGAGALLGHRLIVMAYRDGEANQLAPFGYLGLVWGFMLGALLFGEPVGAASAVGAAAIGIGGVIAIRELVERSRVAAIAAQPGRDPAIDDDEDAPDDESRSRR